MISTLGRLSSRIAVAFLALLAVVFLALSLGPTSLALVAGLIAAAALTFLLTAALLNPLRRITSAARGIASGNLSERVEPRPSGEIGDLTDAFNDMARVLDQLLSSASQDRNRMRAAFNSSADAIVALNEHGAVAFANAAAGQLLQRSQQQLLGTPFAWILPAPQVVDALRTSSEQKQPRTIEVERPNRRFVQIMITPILDGGEWASLAVFHDVSEVRRTEQVRRDFVANVSHELRTPLSALKSVIETLQSGSVDDPATVREFLSRADSEVDRLVQMVEELLQLSRIESGEVPLDLRELDIADVISTAVRRVKTQADKQGVTISVEVAPQVPPVTADRVLLERAVENLVHNSVKFTPSGGSIDVFASANNGSLTIAVRDTGEGIDASDLPRVFERFYKVDRARSAGGTGLGLAIVKHMAEAHGGTVHADSEPGKGSTFTFSIPVRPAPA